MIPIVSIVGRSKAGKTTVMEKLIAELKRRGYRVGTVKHHSHGDFDIDLPGKDSWRHAQAGSDHVVVASPTRLASVRRLSRELSLDEIAAEFSDVDIILTDGFKREDKPKVEVSRQAVSTELLCKPEELIAIVSDQRFVVKVPQFEFEDVAGLADRIERLYLVKAEIVP
jgi:molybdopterin-guanine dinucleotide biosynthesis protein B